MTRTWSVQMATRTSKNFVRQALLNPTMSIQQYQFLNIKQILMNQKLREEFTHFQECPNFF